MSNQPQIEVVSKSGQFVPMPANYEVESRDPTSADAGYIPATPWINKITGDLFFYGTTEWKEILGPSFPISPYVVGPSGQAGYQTVQSAINAASAAGGGTVYIQPGIYTENLALADGVYLMGASALDEGYNGKVTISGVHTPPASGTFAACEISFASATHIFSSAVQGTADLSLFSCSANCTNGYTFNLASWDGAISVSNFNTLGTADGFVNNVDGTSPVSAFNSNIGIGATNCLIGGSLIGADFVFNVPLVFLGTSTYSISNSIFNAAVSMGSTAGGSFVQSVFASGSASAITYESATASSLQNCVINSSNTDAIAGTGAGVITLNQISFVASSGIAGTLTTSKAPRTTVAGLNILTGTNATTGISAAMTAGTITISTTAVKAGSIIHLTRNTVGGTTGNLSAPTASIVAGTSFVINSSSGTDTSTVNWLIIN